MSDGRRATVKYGNLIGVPLLVALAGLGRLVQRRRLMRQTYLPAARGGA
jgi:hypothetical protein